MANADNTTEEPANLSQDKWPHEPEGMIEFMPDDLSGSPYDMLFTVLTRAQGIVAVLCAEFIGDDDYRPKAPDIVGALSTAQNHLKLALDLMERLDVVESNVVS